MILYLLFFATAAGVVVIAVDPGRPRRDAPPAPRPEGADHQPRGRHAVDRLRRRPVRSPPSFPSSPGPGRAEHRIHAERIADDDVRRHGPRHRVQRARPTGAIPPAASYPPILKALAHPRWSPSRWSSSRTELPGLQRALMTTSLTGPQWLACIGLALVLLIVIEVSKWIRRRQRRRRRRHRGAACGRPGACARRRDHVTSRRSTNGEGGRVAKNKKKHKGEPAADAAADASGSEQGEHAGSAAKMKRKPYEQEMRRLHGELVALQEWVKATRRQGVHRLRGARHRGQGRHHQADHGAGEPPGVPSGRAARTDRAGEVADVRPALHPAPPGRGRGGDLRPQLVQPGRGRAGDGLLHRGADEAVPGGRSGSGAGDGRLRHHPPQVLAGGRAPTSRPAAWRAASTTLERSGSCRTWT